MPRVFALLLLPLLAVAAPVPKATEEAMVKKLFGTPTPGEKNDEFTPDGGRLSIRIPSGVREKRTEGCSLAAVPRTERTATGDFEVTVKLIDCTKITAAVGESAEIDAGLFVAAKGQVYTLHLRHNYDGGPGATDKSNASQLWLDRDPGYGGSVDHTGKFPREQVSLRFKRTGAKLVALLGDGDAWAEVDVIEDAKLTDEVTVGVFVAQSGTKQATTARFEKFTLTEQKPEKK